MKCLLVGVVFGLVCCSFGQKIDTDIWTNLQKSEPTNVLVNFVGVNIDECYAKLDALKISGTTKIVENLMKILKAQAESIQKPVIQALNFLGIKIISRQVWLTGQLVIYAVTRACIEALANNAAVLYVEAEKFLNMHQDTKVEVVPTKTQWGIEKINASYAWKTYDTEGINVVVGIIDTGALYTHEALKKRYRGWKGQNIATEHNYNWLDAGAISKGEKPSLKPVDTNGHGTHCTGTICGDVNNIGVARRAKWISCRCSKSSSFSNQGLLLCGQFMLCPTDVNNKNEDCSKKPHIINNSWAGGGGDGFFDNIVKAWNKANIVSFFAAGNSKNNCGNIGSPADREGSIAVGSTDERDKISSFSSVGPTKDGRKKPDFAAPGSNITSAWPTGNQKYAKISGTSMATPHVVGTAALIVGYFIKNNIKYTIANVVNVLKDGAQHTIPTGETCNNIKDDTYPNNYVGAGRISASVSLSKKVLSKYGTNG